MVAVEDLEREYMKAYFAGVAAIPGEDGVHYEFPGQSNHSGCISGLVDCPSLGWSVDSSVENIVSVESIGDEIRRWVSAHLDEVEHPLSENKMKMQIEETMKRINSEREIEIHVSDHGRNYKLEGVSNVKTSAWDRVGEVTFDYELRAKQQLSSLIDQFNEVSIVCLVRNDTDIHYLTGPVKVENVHALFDGTFHDNVALAKVSFLTTLED